MPMNRSIVEAYQREAKALVAEVAPLRSIGHTLLEVGAMEYFKSFKEFADKRGLQVGAMLRTEAGVDWHLEIYDRCLTVLDGDVPTLEEKMRADGRMYEKVQRLNLSNDKKDVTWWCGKCGTNFLYAVHSRVQQAARANCG